MDCLRGCVYIERLDPPARAATELFESWMRGNLDWYTGRTRRFADLLSTHALISWPLLAGRSGRSSSTV